MDKQITPAQHLTLTAADAVGWHKDALHKIRKGPRFAKPGEAQDHAMKRSERQRKARYEKVIPHNYPPLLSWDDAGNYSKRISTREYVRQFCASNTLVFAPEDYEHLSDTPFRLYDDTVTVEEVEEVEPEWSDLI